MQPEWPRLANYEILDELGRGGMGVVYLARQAGFDRLVGLKMILAGPFAGPQHLARFRVEAKAVASLDHPNIVRVYDYGEQNRLPFYSMELVEGSSLADRLALGPFPVAKAARLVQTLAQAMQHAHDRGVIHRDLKPANILLTADGMPKITDFGLAKRLDSQGGLSSTGAVLGTPSYMAPEQALGQNKEVGPAADIYALGAILYELLTGRRPFVGTTPLQILDAVRSQEPQAPTLLRPDLPHELEAICLKCLNKEVARRYPTAGALNDDLGRFLVGEVISAAVAPGVAPPGWPEIPGYRVVNELPGPGLIYEVYEAVRIEDNRRMVIKVLVHPALTQAARLARLRETAGLVSALDHPNLARLYAFGEQAGRPYRVEEFVGGQKLSHQLERQDSRMPPPAATRLVRTLALALHHAHQHSMAHGSLEPRTIFLGRDGAVKVTDVGLVNLPPPGPGLPLLDLHDPGRADPAPRPRRGSFPNPAYLPPEILFGDEWYLSAPADVYGLGATLYRLLTGHPPLRSGYCPGVVEFFRHTLSPPSDHNQDVPRELGAICLKCLSKDPAKRYPDARYLAEHLGLFLQRQAKQ
jgi:serine/threonine protein kinase